MPDTLNAPAHWTVETAYIHLAQRVHDLDARLQQRIDDTAARLVEKMDELDKRTDINVKAVEDSAFAASAANDKAVSKVEVSMDRRFEAANEMKQAMHNQQSTFVPRMEVDSKFESSNSLVKKLETQAAEFMTRREIESKLDTQTEIALSNTNRITQMEARTAGRKSDWSGIAAAVSTLVAVLTVILLVFFRK